MNRKEALSKFDQTAIKPETFELLQKVLALVPEIPPSEAPDLELASTSQILRHIEPLYAVGGALAVLLVERTHTTKGPSKVGALALAAKVMLHSLTATKDLSDHAAIMEEEKAEQEKINKAVEEALAKRTPPQQPPE